MRRLALLPTLALSTAFILNRKMKTGEPRMSLMHNRICQKDSVHSPNAIPPRSNCLNI
jgi:hypothetical protein